jgi:hypothetical protein
VLKRLIESIADAIYYILSIHPLYLAIIVLVVVLALMFLRRDPSR